eukprot:SAG11_NODE_15985_length_560_cov_1.351410_2_plen_40_part_01
MRRYFSTINMTCAGRERTVTVCAIERDRFAPVLASEVRAS